MIPRIAVLEQPEPPCASSQIGRVQWSQAVVKAVSLGSVSSTDSLVADWYGRP